MPMLNVNSVTTPKLLRRLLGSPRTARGFSSGAARTETHLSVGQDDVYLEQVVDRQFVGCA